MRVGTRLYLAVLPAILGVALVAALAYWGRMNHQVPPLIVGIAVIASVASLVLVWRHTRYVASRIGQLARPRPTSAGVHRLGTDSRDGDVASSITRLAPADELDEIEATVEGLSSGIVTEREAGLERARVAEARAATYEALLEHALFTTKTRLDEVHLPIHILLSSPFGSLNDNQEEILGAAQRALDTADIELRQIQKLIAAERGALTFIPERISLQELLRAPLVIATAHARAPQPRIEARLPDELPRVIVDAMQAQEALTAILCATVLQPRSNSGVMLVASEERSRVVTIRVTPGIAAEEGAGFPLTLRLASQVLSAQNATASFTPDHTTIELSSEGA